MEGVIDTFLEEQFPSIEVAMQEEKNRDERLPPMADTLLLSSPESTYALYQKINERMRILYVYDCDKFGNGLLKFTSGDKRSKATFGTDDISSLTMRNLIGAATCEETLKRIFTSLAMGIPSEAYINLYAASKKPFSAYVSFRVNSVTASPDYSQKTICGVLNIAAASVVGNIKFLASLS